MAKKKQSQLAALFSNARTRTFVIFFGAIFVSIGIFTYIKTRPVEDPLAKEGSRAASVPRQIKSVPGAEVTQKYKELTKAENERRAQEALKKNSASIPTIIGAIADEDKTEGGVSLDDELAGKGAKKPTFQLGQAEQSGFIGQGLFQSNRNRELQLQEKRLQAQRERLEQQRREREAMQRQQQERQAAAQKQQEYQQAVQQQAQQMAAGVQNLNAQWSQVVPQTYVQGQWASKEVSSAGSSIPRPNILGTPRTPSSLSSSLPSRAGRETTTAAKQRVVKAGTILFAVLDTSIDTDIKSPVLATIVHGQFKGGKLIGDFAFGPRDEALQLTFRTLSMPKEPSSYGVNIVAVDPDTAKTALQGDLNKHYFVRYGALFASSFIEGYAQAISGQGTTTTSPLTGATTETKPTLSGTEEFFTALGLVGQKWGQTIQPFIERPYTIKIPEGTGIGLLFLSDTNLTPNATAGG